MHASPPEGVWKENREGKSDTSNTTAVLSSGLSTALPVWVQAGAAGPQGHGGVGHTASQLAPKAGALEGAGAGRVGHRQGFSAAGDGTPETSRSGEVSEW